MRPSADASWIPVSIFPHLLLLAGPSFLCCRFKALPFCAASPVPSPCVSLHLAANLWGEAILEGSARLQKMHRSSALPPQPWAVEAQQLQGGWNVRRTPERTVGQAPPTERGSEAVDC